MSQPLSSIKPNLWAILIGAAIPLLAILWYAPIFSAQLAIVKPTVIDISVQTPNYVFTWERYFSTLFNSDKQWTRIVALGSIPNAIIFYYFLNKNKLEITMGLFYGSLITLSVVGIARLM